nr:3A [mischivirus A1]
APDDPPSFEDFLLQMNLATRERDIIIQEMRELKQGIQETKQLQLEFYSLVLVVGGIAGLCYGAYKTTSAICEYLMPDTPPKEDEETQIERAPFLEPAQAQ